MQEPITSIDQPVRTQRPVLLVAATAADWGAREVGRARRYRRPLAVMVLAVETDADQALVGAMLRHLLRPWDVVGRLAAADGAERGPGVVAILPETDGDGAVAALRRVSELLPELCAGVATCPRDGASLGTLVAAAWRRRGRIPPGEGHADAA
jgi:hypothetical protein